VEISNAVLYLNQCRVTLFTRPFRVNAKAASSSEVVTSAGGSSTQTSSAGGDHRHLVAFANSTSNNNPGEQLYVFSFPTAPDGSSPASLGMAVRSVGSLTDIYTGTSSGDHSHTINIPPHTHTVPSLLIDYGIEDDTQYPNTLRMRVNGVDVTETLGGPWGAGGAEVNTTVDVTEYLTAASGGLRQRHKIELTCNGGQGEVEVTVELRTTTQSIVVT
jgi:hypothetical protein